MSGSSDSDVNMRIEPHFLSLSERAALMSCVRSHREDHGIARRANAILLLDDGESCAQIAKFLYLDDDTIRSWHRTYRNRGWDALSTDCWSVPHDAGSRGGTLRVVGRTLLSIDGRDQGAHRGAVWRGLFSFGLYQGTVTAVTTGRFR